jgi:hypothetical protein
MKDLVRMHRIVVGGMSDADDCCWLMHLCKQRLAGFFWVTHSVFEDADDWRHGAYRTKSIDQIRQMALVTTELIKRNDSTY